MPFNYGPYIFNEAGIQAMTEGGGVYGLARPSETFGYFRILYVGKSGNLRERLTCHLNNPPVAGITHFFAEAVGTDAARTEREYSLIQEFKPVGNTLLK
jgi:excinuclease UvrABC nuclease subunit